MQLTGLLQPCARSRQYASLGGQYGLVDVFPVGLTGGSSDVSRVVPALKKMDEDATKLHGALVADPMAGSYESDHGKAAPAYEHEEPDGEQQDVLDAMVALMGSETEHESGEEDGTGDADANTHVLA